MSPVFGAMFGGAGAESMKTEIPLPDDELEAMLIVLQIAHLKFQNIPQKGCLAFSDLVDLAVVCDKYDLVSVVRPFFNLHQWLDPYRGETDQEGSEELLHIGWTFGDIKIFKETAKSILLNSHLDSDSGKLINGTGKVLEGNMPSDIIGKPLVWTLVFLLD